jgi:integrase
MEGVDDELLYEEFIEDMKVQGKTKKTIQNYGSCLKEFLNWLHDKKHVSTDVQGKVGKRLLIEYLKHLREKKVNGSDKLLSFARIKIYFSALNCYYDFLIVTKELLDNNIVLPIRRRYLKPYKNGYKPAERKFINVDEMRRFIKSIFNLQDRVIVAVFVKTGIRQGELIAIDFDDVDLEERTIILKDIFRKRTNLIVVFDEECKNLLQQWMQRREILAEPGVKSLFLNEYGGKIYKNKVYNLVTYWAKRYGIHNASSPHLKDHFSPHNLRHCFVTYLSEAQMYEPFINWLRGDSPGKAIDYYKHIRLEKIRDAYDKAMPIFGL